MSQEDAASGISGAASGAGAGFAVGGPLGAVIGGVLGGLGGLFKSKKAGKAARDKRRAIRAAYQEKLRQSSFLRKQALGRQDVGYAAAGVDVARGTSQYMQDRVNAEYARQQSALLDAERYALKGATPQADWWGAALAVGKAAGSIYGASAGGGSSPFAQGGANANNPITPGQGSSLLPNERFA
jgi:gas vesicle protein